MSIFDLVKSQELVAYWEARADQRAPYLGEELWPDDKKLGLNLSFIKGSAGLPVVLKQSALDAVSIHRDRIGFDRISKTMPFFKESTLIDEELRQELNMVIETKNQAYIDSVMNRIFNDETSLLDGAAAARERMRMQLLMTGTIAIAANGQNFNVDYGMPATHKATVGVSWTDYVNSTPIDDLSTGLDLIETDTGVRPTRAVCSPKTWKDLKKNKSIINAIYVLAQGYAPVTNTRLHQYLIDELNLDVAVNGKKFINETGNTMAYVPDDTISLFPEGQLGKTWFGTTPEESDLNSTNVANVSITDTGVAVTTMQKADPVSVETKVTMICLPSFELINQIYILDTVKE